MLNNQTEQSADYKAVDLQKEIRESSQDARS